MYLTLRKSFVKSRLNQISHSPVIVNPMKENFSNETELNLVKTCLDKLADDHKKLEAENKAVKKDLVEAIEDSGAKNETIQNLKKQILTSMRKLTTLKKLITVSQLARKIWMISKFENWRLEVKNIKSGIASLKSDKNSLHAR
jgi:hypothetical protein